MEVEPPVTEREVGAAMGCLPRLLAFVFGAPFVGAGLYMVFWSGRALRPLDLAMGVLCLLTGLVVWVPHVVGQRSWQKPLLITWLVVLGGLLGAALLASMLGWV